MPSDEDSEAYGRAPLKSELMKEPTTILAAGDRLLTSLTSS
jgi:hypothetical protein